MCIGPKTKQRKNHQFHKIKRIPVYDLNMFWHREFQYIYISFHWYFCLMMDVDESFTANEEKEANKQKKKYRNKMNGTTSKKNQDNRIQNTISF